MRIGFDCTPLRAPQSGVGTYTRTLLEHLELQAADEFVPLMQAAARVGAPHPGNGSRHLNKTLWMQAVLPWQLSRLRPRVCHFTNSVGPIWAPCATILTIHDMTLWLYPQHHPRRRLLAMRPIIPLAARRASAIIAVSQCTKRDIVRILGVEAEKVHVIYEAPPPTFQPLPGSPVLEATRREYRLPSRFILYVGTIEPRKNLVRLLEAFALLRRGGEYPHGLVLAGPRGWGGDPVFSAIERLGIADAVHHLGYVPPATLTALYNLADALAFPSLYEGFGLPVIEAMACGTAVVTSRNSSLGEIAGDAAELVEPTQVESIAAGLRHVLNTPARRAQLKELGLARASHFSWTRAALETRRLYEQVAGAQGPS